MHKKKRQKFYSTFLVFILLFNIVTQAVAPIVANATDSEDPPIAAASEEEVISVLDLINLDNPETEETVEGYIVGYAISGTNISRDDFRENHNFAIADEPGETDLENMVIVQISSEFRSDFGLNSNPNILDEQVTITGIAEAYHGHYGLKEPSDIQFVENVENPSEPEDPETPENPEEEEPSVPEETEDPVEEEPEPEEPLELLSLAEVRAQDSGEARTSGVVTAILNNTIQIQDGTAGIAVRPTGLDVSLGDEITVNGELQYYNGLLQLNNASLEENTGNSALPDPIVLTGAELVNHQSELAVMKNIEITDVNDGGSWANYTAVDSDGTEFLIRDENNSLDLVVDGFYDSITGIVSTFNEDQQIIPRSNQDIIADVTTVQPVYASPESGTVPNGTEVSLNTQTPDETIYYTTDGSDPVEESNIYTEPLIVEDDVTIRALAVAGELTPSDINEFSYEVYDAEDGLQIHNIQGASHESPMNGSIVNGVEGIVTYIYEIQGANYFHLQTPEENYDGDPKTSEGIVVYTGQAEDVSIGDLVAVTGTVDEYHIDGYDDNQETDLSVTQINARDDQGGIVEVLESDQSLPAPIEITSSDIPSKISGEAGFDVFEPENYSIDFWESIEGMRVEIAPSEAIAPQEHGDLVVVTEEFEPELETSNGGILLSEFGPNAQSIQFKLQPNGPARELAVKTGDRFPESVPGVVNYGYGNYKVYADLNYVQEIFEEGPTEPEETSIVKDEDQLTVATYNVENFSANTSYTSNEKAENIARAFVQDMNSPDIIGIVEVMANDATDSTSPEANESYERLITAIETAGGPTYDYANIDPEYNQDGGAPGGNIRVGYLYNPNRVSLMDAEHGGTHEAVSYEDGELTLNPGRVTPELFTDTRKPLAAQFEFQGESVVVVNNHLNSKSGDDPYYGQNQPPVLRSEAQRHDLAQEINRFVSDILTDNPEENVVVLGDMNDFQFSETLSILEGDELTNLVNSVPVEERYNYVYQGNSQVLDHILVSNNLADTAEIDMIHVNADFTDMHGRASDHDPVLAQLDLGVTEESEEPTDPEGFDLSLMHMNDTHSRVENYAHMITAMDEFRLDHPDSLLLHAGDVFSGTLYFNEYEGQADLALMNLMDIDAMVFGNHEFDLGDSEDGHQALANFVDGANFPFLGTNIDFSNDEVMAPYETNASLVSEPNNGEIYNSIITEVNGEEIGIFGLNTEDTAAIASPVDVTFSNFADAAEEAVTEFEEAGIDKIIALTHLGFDSAPAVGNDLRLADEVEGIDIIVGGHSHTALTEPVLVNNDTSAPTVIVQAGENAENLGTLNVTFNDDGEIVNHAGELLEVADYDQDPEAAEVLAPYQAAVEALNNEEIGAEAMKDLLNPRHGDGDEVSVRANETELGNLVTDAMLYKAQEKFPETVIAFQNGGGIRAPIDQGPITTGEVIEVLPFGNNPVIADLTGQEIKDILEFSVREAPEEVGGFLHVSGMQFFYDSESDVGDRIQGMYILQGGELVDGELVGGERIEIDLDEEYLVTTNGFTGQGGDDFDTFAQAYEEGRVRDIGEIDWEQLRDYMVEDEYLAGVVDPVIEGRIIDLLGESLPDFSGSEDSIDDLRERIEALEERLAALETQNEEVANELARLRAALAELQEDSEDYEERLAELEAQIAALEARLAEPDGEDPDGTDPDSDTSKDEESDGTGSDSDTPKDEESDGTDTAGEDSKDEKEDSSLPTTGTTIVFPLIGGISLLLTGIGIDMYRRKSKEK